MNHNISETPFHWFNKRTALRSYLKAIQKGMRIQFTRRAFSTTGWNAWIHSALTRGMMMKASQTCSPGKQLIPAVSTIFSIWILPKFNYKRYWRLQLSGYCILTKYLNTIFTILNLMKK